MTKLWLTYAWKDNEDEQLDFIVQSLEAQGLDVGFDRARLIPGQRLWPQLDSAISDPTRSDAWALHVTRNSLSSEPCLEELAYALDRALRSRGASFPLISILPEPIDRALIPSAIATRLYVNLRDPNWAQQVAAGARVQVPGRPPQIIAEVFAQEHRQGEKTVLEVRPRAGRWYPFVVVLPPDERTKIAMVVHGPSGRPPGACMVSSAELRDNQGRDVGVQINHAIDALNSAYIVMNTWPRTFSIGQSSGQLYTMSRAA